MPNIPTGQGGNPVLVSDGVPGWAVYIGGISQTTMFHNDVSIGAAEVAIYGPQWFASQILEGSYTVSLQPSTAGPLTTSGIGQTGQIPSTAASVRFFGHGSFNLTFAGQQIPLVALGGTAGYTIFGGNISSFDNQTGELLFQGGGLLDNIFFSNQPIPEPSTVGLFGLSAVVLGWRFRRKRP